MWARVRAVVFDFDGTLAATHIDFAAMREDTYELLRRFGVYSEACREMMVLEMVAAGCARLGRDSEAAAELVRASEEVLRRREIEAAARASEVPGAGAALQRVRDSGRRVGIITRNCRAAVDTFSQRYRLVHDELVTRDEARAVKPDPEHLLQCLELLDCAPAEAAMVGDHWSDVECGQGAGAATIAVLSDSTPRERFERMRADAIIRSVAELPELLGASG